MKIESDNSSNLVTSPNPLVFISYSRLDTPVIKQIYLTLKLAGYRPWMDTEDILPGQDWYKQITCAIKDSTIFIAFISKNSINKRGMLQVELKEAFKVWQSKLIDDIYLIPVRLEECEVSDELSKFQWLDLYDISDVSRLFAAIRHQMERLGLYHSLRLRSHPTDLSREAASRMAKDRDFYDRDHNWNGRGIMHQYERFQFGEDELIIDYTTSLVWQQNGSFDELLFAEAEEYITKLNQKNPQTIVWRLPTLEEALSLMESKQSESGLHISALFNKEQSHIWTSDGFPEIKWSVHYISGFYGFNPIKQHPYRKYVRAVTTYNKEVFSQK
jgi:hypothetical protein